MNNHANKRNGYKLSLLVIPSVVTVLFMVFSCTGMVGTGNIKKSGAVETKDELQHFQPDVTGEVRLSFIKSFGTNTGLSSPWGISFGVDGTLYVCDRDRSGIVRLDREGNNIAVFSGSGSRIERLYSPIDVCSSGGMAIYAVDAANSHILRFDRNLKNAYVIYKKDSAENKLFGSFNGLAFDKTTGDLFVTDRDTGALIRIDMLGGSIKSRGAFGTGKDSFHEPAGLDVTDDGTIIIADTDARAVAILNHFSAEINYIGEKLLEAPVDVAALPNGSIAVADKRGLLVLSLSGIPKGRAGYGEDRILSPRSVAFYGGELYVSDAVSATILVYKVE